MPQNFFLNLSQKEEGKGREIETFMKEKYPSAAFCAPPTGIEPDTRHVPGLGIKSVTTWCMR